MVHHEPRFVDEPACTGCRLCEQACTVAVPDQFNGEMVSRRAAYIPFPQAIPQKALIERAGTSPCIAGCPAGIKAHGYVSLVRGGEYEKAFSLVLETTPLAGSLGRACYAPCEAECTRGGMEGPVAIRRLKRFVADRHYQEHGIPNGRWLRPSGKRVAVVGSGPAGLTAAWQLARGGHRVKVFEAAPVPGGALRLSIPSYRLPAEVVERDIANLTALGAEIETNVRVRSYLEVLAERGLPAAAAVPGEVVIHDSCVYARAENVIEAPRQLLTAAGLTVREPASSGKQTWCCGGPAEALFPARAAAVAASRVSQLRAVAPDCVTMCPICLVNLRKAAPDGSLRVRDISEYLAGMAGTVVRP